MDKNSKTFRDFLSINEVSLSIPFSYELEEDLPVSGNTATERNLESEVRLEIESGSLSGQDMTVHTLDYKTDWNLLIEVVKEIEDIEEGRFEVTIFGDSAAIRDSYSCKIIILHTADTKLDVVYQVCLKFIENYNKGKYKK